MYRAWPATSESIYCDKTRCDRHCGRFHPKFLANTRRRRKKLRPSHSDYSSSTLSTSSSRDIARSLNSSPLPPIIDPIFPQEVYPTFEEIMAEAARKVSAGYRSPPLPPYAFGDVRPPVVKKRSDSYRTATASSNRPRLDSVWDDEEFRRQMLDSDEEGFLNGDPPSVLDESESLIDTIIESSKPDIGNPLYESDGPRLHSSYVSNVTAEAKSEDNASTRLRGSRLSLDSLFNEITLLSPRIDQGPYETSLDFHD